MQVHDVVMVMDEGLRPAACQVATALRQAGRIVDVVLEVKKMKQVFKVHCMLRHFMCTLTLAVRLELGKLMHL